MATGETKSNSYNSCFNSKHSDLKSSRKNDAMNEFLSPSQQSRRPNILRMVENLSDLENGPLCTLGVWRMLVKLLCSVCQPEKFQCAETLLEDNISNDLQVQCVHTMVVGLKVAFILQLYTVER